VAIAMDRSGIVGLAALMPAATMVALTACGGGGGGDGTDEIPPFDMQAGVVATDLDGDGDVDVAVANTHVAGPPPHPGSVRIYLHEPSGPRSFRESARYDAGADPWDLTAADLTADDVTDLVVATPDGDQVWLLQQDPARRGTFIAARSFATPRAPYQAAAADLDGDQRNDLAVALNSNTPGGIALLFQDPAVPGDFRNAVHVPVGYLGTTVATADIDGDDRIDLLRASGSTDPARAGVYLSRQDPILPGTFLPAVKLLAGQRPRHVAVADLNADSRLDLVVANDGIDGRGSGITVLLADPANPGQFHAGTFYPMSDIARMSCIADLDGDGLPDLEVAAMVPGLVNDYESVVQLFVQDPARPGHFVRGGRHDSGDLAEFIAVADLDGDGLVDVVTGEGPKVLYNDATRPGTLQAVRPL
jgi:hypothetical protein